MQTQPLTRERMFILEPAITDMPGIERVITGNPGDELMRAKSAFFNQQENMLTLAGRLKSQFFVDPEINSVLISARLPQPAVRRGIPVLAPSRTGFFGYLVTQVVYADPPGIDAKVLFYGFSGKLEQ